MQAQSSTNSCQSVPIAYSLSSALPLVELLSPVARLCLHLGHADRSGTRFEGAQDGLVALDVERQSSRPFGEPVGMRPNESFHLCPEAIETVTCPVSRMTQRCRETERVRPTLQRASRPLLPHTASRRSRRALHSVSQSAESGLYRLFRNRCKPCKLRLPKVHSPS